MALTNAEITAERAEYFKGLNEAVLDALCQASGPWFVQIVCWIAKAILSKLLHILVLLATLAKQTISIALKSVGSRTTQVDFAQVNHNILKQDGMWAFDSMGILNKKSVYCL